MTRLRPPGRRQSPSVSPRRPAALRPGTRLGGGGRRTPTVRRASAGLTPSRAGALLALLLAVGGVYGAVSSDAFAARSVVVDGTTWTPESVVTDTLAIPAGQNLFTLRTGPLLEALARIPAVRSASIEVALPDEVRVHVTERRALIVWQAAGRRMLVDDQGYLFASLPDTVPQAAGALPVITDARSSGEALVVGSTLDAQDLDAALRLGSLVPTDLGSGAARLQLRVDDTDGYTIRAVPTGWTAVFGFYTPTLRRTDLIPGQVRLLRSLLAGREAGVLRIILADDRSGTYVPRPSPSPAASETP